MSKLGKRLVKGMKDLLAGKPMRQTIRRRMVVKGKTVYTRESYVAPALKEKK